MYADEYVEPRMFLLKNVAYRFRSSRLRMTCSSRAFLLLFLLALVVFPCAPERVKRQKAVVVRQRDGGEDIIHNDHTQGGQQQGLTKSNGHGSEEETKENEPLSGRSELTNTYSIAPL